MPSILRPRFLLLAAAAFLAGCGADSGVTPITTPVSLDQVFKEMSLPAISGARSAATGAQGPTVPFGTSIPTGCTYALASQSFVCAPITASGLTITQNYTLLNGSGGPLAFFDATSLAAVRIQSTIAGNQTSTDGTFNIDGRCDQTLSGLQTSKHVLNGTTTMNMTGTFNGGFIGGPEPINISVKYTTTDLVIPANAGSSTYPASGSIAMEFTSASSGPTSATNRMVMTFNGTSKVKITINGVAVSGCSTIDLSSTSPGCS
jgi:hypothetical protein